MFEVARGYIPIDIDPNETDVDIEFDWAPPEPRTFNYPGSPGGIWITKVTTDAGKELDVDVMSDETQQHFIEIAGEHLARNELSERESREVAAEMEFDRRREEVAEAAREKGKR